MDAVKIVEVGPRDGLQNEPAKVSPRDKVGLIEDLADAGLPVVEAGAFVSPKWAPRMADSGDVLRAINRRDGVSYPVLVPNMKGFEAAVAAGAEEIAVFGAASESFSMKNINCSIADSLNRFEPILEAAGARSIRVRGYVSCALGCPYEGEVAASAVADVSATLFQMGCYEVSLGDTIGVGTPKRAVEMVRAVAEGVPMERLAAHFHDTYGQALANLFAVMEVGLRTIDAAVAGLGGCPYASGASGNVATEDVVYLLDGLGVETGVDLDAVAAVGRRISAKLGRTPASKAGNALAGKARRVVS